MPSEKQAAVKTVRILQQAGYTALFAGGCVRDIILNRKPKDYDIATSASPRQIEVAIPKTKPIGKSFGVIQAETDGFLFEIATFRNDHGASDGRHPDSITFSSPRKDALRRDFTMNAIFLDPISNEFLDFVNGIRDVRMRVIRCVGSPSRRFSEDHLRMLRAVRFASTLGFRLDFKTSSEIKRKAHFIKRISSERVREELSRILHESDRPGSALRLIHKLDLLQNILTETCRSSSNFQLTHLFRLIDELPARDNAPLLTALTLRTGAMKGRKCTYAVIEDLQKSTAIDLKSIRLSNRTTREILKAQSAYWLLRSADGQVSEENLPALACPQAKTAIDIIKAESKLTPSLKKVYRRANSYAAKTRKLLKKPLINGNDLITQGVKPGPEMKRLLHQALVLQAQGKIKTKAEMLKAIRQS